MPYLAAVSDVRHGLPRSKPAIRLTAITLALTYIGGVIAKNSPEMLKNQ